MTTREREAGFGFDQVNKPAKLHEIRHLRLFFLGEDSLPGFRSEGVHSCAVCVSELQLKEVPHCVGRKAGKHFKSKEHPVNRMLLAT